MRKVFFLSILFASTVSVYSQDVADNKDSTGHDLGEVVVLGEHAWIEDGKYNFIPSKSAKNLSRNMEDLIDRMHTGVLFLENGEIKSRNGQGVSLFINGIPVDVMDKATFWAKNALKVEYMESSDDPQFMGATNIVNFIMRDYVAGGLTKFDGNQQFPNDGGYSVASKLVWGKMTYNALFKGGYSRDHQSGNETTEQYDGIHYNGLYYDNVLRKENAIDVSRNNNLYGGFNARYKTDKFTMTHSVALQWNEDPGSVSEGGLSYSPDIISSDKMISRTRSHSLAPHIEGLYVYQPSSKWMFAFNWTFSHSHNNNKSSYEDLGLSPILNDTKENIYEMNGRITSGYRPKNNLYFEMAVAEMRSISDVNYKGNVNSIQWLNNGNTKITLRGWWMILNNLVLDLTPRLSIFDYDVNHITKRTECLPGINGIIRLGINSKNTLALSSYYTQTSPSQSQRNDLILRSTELKWIEGNPHIGSSSMYWISLAYNTYPCAWFNSNFSLDYIANSNVSYLSYRTGGEKYDGVIGQYEVSPMERQYRGFWNMNLTLFKGAVNIGNQLEYTYQRISGRGLGYVRVRPNINWNFGNCSLYFGYGSPQKILSEGGTRILRSSSYYDFRFSYGNGNLIFDVNFSSPFNKYSKNTIIVDNGPYHYTSRDWSNGRNVSVSLIYTFDYGKKVDPGVDISEQEIRSTSVLGSDN